MKSDHKQLLHYIAKCITGTALAFVLFSLFHFPELTWFLVSMMLVLSPDRKDAIPLAVTNQ